MKNCLSNVKKYSLVLFVFSFLVLFTLLPSCASQETAQQISPEYQGLKHNDNYQLEQMSVLSRHNVRSPLTDSTSKVSQNCSYKWHDWSSNYGELSLLGGQSETMMGQYFKKYLEQEKLIPDNWSPKEDETFFYANSMQRTIATASFFSTGMLPTVNTQILHKNINDTDFALSPVLHDVTDDFKNKIEEELNNAYGGNYKDLKSKLQDNYQLIKDVIGYKGNEDFNNDEIVVSPSEGKQFFNTKGFVNDLFAYADALCMQYFEEPDDAKAAFGKKLSFEEWKKIGEIVDTEIFLVCGTHTMGTKFAHSMLNEIKKDIDNPQRKFSYICGHDTTLTTFLSALNVKWDALPYNINSVAPIGGKVVLSKYKNNSGEKFMQISYVYESSDQIRHYAQLDLNNPPVAFPLEFNGLQKNQDGFYKLDDIEKRLNEAIAEGN